MSTLDAVERLVRRIGLPEPEQPIVDWDALQSALGRRIVLPTDFKAFVDRVPRGQFGRAVTPNYPGHFGYPADDFLAPVEYITSTFTEWREAGTGVFPYPLFPEPGGLLIWATGTERTYFWLTGNDDPDSWPVVHADRDFIEWDTFDGGMAQFLLAEDTAGRLPSFQPFPTAPVVKTPAVKDNEKQRWPSVRAPINQADALLAALNPPSSWARHHDWSALETRLQRRLPADYKAFIDACGPGRLCDIDIYGPCRCRDMVSLQQTQTAWAATDADIRRDYSFYPALAGLLCWGVRADGAFLNWKTVAADPDEWSAAIINNYAPAFYDDLSMSTFLLRFSGTVTPPLLLMGPPWTEGLTFTPHQCTEQI